MGFYGKYSILDSFFALALFSNIVAISKVLTNNYRLKDHYIFHFTEKSAANSIRIAKFFIGCKSRQLGFYKSNKRYENSLRFWISSIK
jgi:hypothetical protein